MSLKDRLLEAPLAYRLLQAPFAERKLAPVLAATDLRRVGRVLDVGCGPGTNAVHFLGCDYLGIDINPAYVESARRRFPVAFQVADVTRLQAEAGAPFDLILVNSILHHLDDRAVTLVMSSLERLLAADGSVHVLELVAPAEPGLARTLARLDRGRHARPLERWRALLEPHFEPVRFQPYALGLLGVPLWQMVHFQGRRRRAAPAPVAVTPAATPRL